MIEVPKIDERFLAGDGKINPFRFWTDKENLEMPFPKGVPVWVSYGGGRDSTAMLIKMVEKGIRPDVIAFSDTGGEKQPTYEYVDMFSKWLVKQGFPEVTILTKKMRDGSVGTLTDECFRKKTLPSLAFGFKKCSQKFKHGPQEKHANSLPMCKETWKRGEQVIKLIGFDTTEVRRATYRYSVDGKYIYYHPLLTWGIDKFQCIKIIEDAGFTAPPKSACFYCPAAKKHEILALTPEERKVVIAMEANAQENLGTVKGLGRSYSWTELLEADESQLKMFDDTELSHPQIPCDCWDGTN